MLRQLYDCFILKYPLAVFLCLTAAIVFLGIQSQKLGIDASSETLVLQNDVDLENTRLVSSRYGTQDFLFITFKPNQDLLDDRTLTVIKNIKNDLEALAFVDNVYCILNVPLLQSPPKEIKELLKAVPTLETDGIDRELVRQEFLQSPIYQKMLVSADSKTTALQVNLVSDKKWENFLARRKALQQKAAERKLTPQERLESEQIEKDFKIYRDQSRKELHENIRMVRELMDKYRGEGQLFLGGVSMIADDIITFLKNDLLYFGVGVLAFLIIMLMVIFRQARWILLPVLCCSFSVIATTGILGMFDWEVTVISSNFISIQIIITMAVTIHLIVRYRELVLKQPDSGQKELLLDTVSSMWKPCVYAILTTVAGFTSLVLSGILPVITFGWMMSVGVSLSLLITFIIVPTVLMMMKKLTPNTSFESKFAFTKKLADFTEKRGKLINWLTALVLVLSIIGASRLIVENAFIDYFKKSTEIYQGMAVIDRELGGTTPLDVVVDFPVSKQTEDTASEDEDDEFGDLEAEFEEAESQAQYWFTSEKMETILKVHNYLDSLPETGKVMSLGTMLQVGEILNDGKPMDDFMMSLVYQKLPERFRKIILSPYVSIENNQVRFSIRTIDSLPDIRRNELLNRIKTDLHEKVGLEKGTYHLTSLLVLYNNMLQSLFNSQILTLGAVIGALMCMFLILFRSFKIAFIAIVPNILSVGAVLGFMGWIGIPLDIMTITIASISVGIAVDDTIHYIHRFKREFIKDRNYLSTMHRCHESIGYAMYYTSITIIIGFSILVTSNFIPTIYFGLLTGLAMIIALIAALTLLPQLIILLKPFGPEQEISAPIVDDAVGANPTT